MAFLQRIWPFLLIAIAYCLGQFMDIMDVDAAQYASISQEMLEKGNFLQVTNRYEAYLDKPPLLFWVSALSFKLFGVSNFSYRLLPILFSFLGIYATYRFAKLYYHEKAAYLAALILASCQAYFLMNHDVRTDTLLTCFVTVAIWQLAVFNKTSKLSNLIVGFICIGLAMLAKGPIGLVVPFMAFFTDFFLRRDGKAFFRWQWLLGILIIAIVLAPMCWGLYQQFGIKGLRFYFWTQSFGRITGENTWSNDTSFFFLAENFIWSFLPWTLLFIPALIQRIFHILRQSLRLYTQEEGISLGGFLLPFIALSLSQYKLPHYSFVVFPMGAVLLGHFIWEFLGKNRSWRRFGSFIQALVCIVLWLLIGGLIFYCFPTLHWFWITLYAILALVSLGLLFFAKSWWHKVILASLWSIVGVNILLNGYVYPKLLTYQAPTVVAKYVNAHPDINKNRFFYYKIHLHSLDFYSQEIIPDMQSLAYLEEQVRQYKTPYWVYTNEIGKQEILKSSLNKQVVKEFEKYHITLLTWQFLNPVTRASVLQKEYLVKIYL